MTDRQVWFYYKMNRNIKKSLTFIGITFFLNYIMVILLLVWGGKWDASISVILGMAYMFIPIEEAYITWNMLPGLSF